MDTRTKRCLAEDLAASLPAPSKRSLGRRAEPPC